MKKALLIFLTVALCVLCLTSCGVPELLKYALFRADYRENSLHEHTIEWEITEQTHKRIYSCCPEYTDTDSPHVDEDENGFCDECGATVYPEFIAIEKGKKYLILPISNEKIEILEEYEQYICEIDKELLQNAEESLNLQTSEYSKKSRFYLQLDNGSLCLGTEIILDIESCTDSQGCGIDHEHLYFKEQITK